MTNELTWDHMKFEVSAMPENPIFTLSDEARFMLGLIELNSIEDVERYLAS